jgi:hypothetical protein
MASEAAPELTYAVPFEIDHTVTLVSGKTREDFKVVKYQTCAIKNLDRGLHPATLYTLHNKKGARHLLLTDHGALLSREADESDGRMGREKFLMHYGLSGRWACLRIPKMSQGVRQYHIGYRNRWNGSREYIAFEMYGEHSGHSRGDSVVVQGSEIRPIRAWYRDLFNKYALMGMRVPLLKRESSP